jgi:hypothetical protein
MIKKSFICEPRGIIDVKGKGSMKTYLLKRRLSESPYGGFAGERINVG